MLARPSPESLRLAGLDVAAAHAITVDAGTTVRSNLADAHTGRTGARHTVADGAFWTTARGTGHRTGDSAVAVRKARVTGESLIAGPPLRRASSADVGRIIAAAKKCYEKKRGRQSAQHDDRIADVGTGIKGCPRPPDHRSVTPREIGAPGPRGKVFPMAPACALG